MGKFQFAKPTSLTPYEKMLTLAEANSVGKCISIPILLNGKLEYINRVVLPARPGEAIIQGLNY